MEYQKKIWIELLKRLVAGGLFLLFAIPPLLHSAEVARMQYMMGSLLEVKAIAKDQKVAEEAVESAFKEVKRIDELLSNYREESEISRINREAYPNGTITSDEIIFFLSQAKYYSEKTDGAFDLTIEPLTQLWNLRERKIQQLPQKKEIEDARSKVNYKNLEISSSLKSVRFLIRGMGIDTGGIGKGYALDRALEKMREFPIQSSILNFGGEILYWSKKPQKKIVAIKDPLSPEKIFETFSLLISSMPTAVSTSGNYERYVTFSSTNSTESKLGHVLNSRVGEPTHHKIRSVTVIQNQNPFPATGADALSTALFSMDLEESKNFSDDLEIATFILYEEQNGKLTHFQSEKWKGVGGKKFFTAIKGNINIAQPGTKGSSSPPPPPPPLPVLRTPSPQRGEGWGEGETIRNIFARRNKRS